MPEQIKQKGVIKLETPQAKEAFNALTEIIHRDLNDIIESMKKEKLPPSVIVAQVSQIKMRLTGEAIRIAQDIDIKWKSYHMTQERANATIH